MMASKDPVLEFLQEGWSESSTRGRQFHYRLVCSGELYAGQVITANWRKSDATRVLLYPPCFLMVASQPKDDWLIAIRKRCEIDFRTP